MMIGRAMSCCKVHKAGEWMSMALDNTDTWPADETGP
jgi:hypothetical protein